MTVNSLPSVLWRCWLGGRKGIRPVKNWVVGCCMVICLERGADLHTVQLMPLPLTVSCFSKIQIGFTFLIPAHLGSPGKRAVKRVYIYIYSLGNPCIESWRRKRKGCGGKDLQKRKVLSLEWKSERVREYQIIVSRLTYIQQCWQIMTI